MSATIERYVLVAAEFGDAWLSAAAERGWETDTRFKITAPSGAIMLHIRGPEEFANELSTRPGCLFMGLFLRGQS